MASRLERTAVIFGVMVLVWGVSGCSYGLKHIDVNQQSDEKWHEIKKGEVNPQAP